MKTLIVILFFGLMSVPSFSQDYSDDNSYSPPEENMVDDYAVEQQRLENEERAREAQMIQDQQPPVEAYDNYNDFGN